ncbi:hypothetical protein QYB95_03165 [Ureibacillus sp. BA0131]|uniref:Cytochrome c oxidase subunit 4 n=1 Tax=Ureibacillus aquaedulcis TaxID=3058421 RepID=A0ABT8GME8_9BACL|nr:hypothetical protein [Ureibacillus sp. BA0131]MDN4492529.1 hypothetical protein [Ureibacillus sp. BA0131]
MLDFGWLNVGSLVLGLIAWIFPVVNLSRYHVKNWVTFSVFSMSACAISLFFQIFYMHHKIKVGDWTALMDTICAVVFASAILLFVTILLNAITVIVYSSRTAK